MGNGSYLFSIENVNKIRKCGNKILFILQWIILNILINKVHVENK